jgi:hypothetical protein
MVTPCKAPRAQQDHSPPGLSGWRRLTTVATISAIALTVVGCSSYATSDKSASTGNKSIRDSVSASQTAVAYSQSGSGTRRSFRALVAPRPAPDCELAGPEPQTMDADLWARLKLDYEQHCYKQAEMLARRQLRRLIASGQCRIGPQYSRR